MVIIRATADYFHCHLSSNQLFPQIHVLWWQINNTDILEIFKKFSKFHDDVLKRLVLPTTQTYEVDFDRRVKEPVKNPKPNSKKLESETFFLQKIIQTDWKISFIHVKRLIVKATNSCKGIQISDHRAESNYSESL